MIIRATDWRGQRLKLVDRLTGIPVSCGDKIKDFRGDESTIIDGTAPKNSASTGRITVTMTGGGTMEYYPSVYGLEWKPCANPAL